MYFSAVADVEPDAWGTFIKDDVRPGSRSEEGVGAGLYLTFKTKEGSSVNVKVGLSYTSVESGLPGVLCRLDTESASCLQGYGLVG